jgi:hypothetical protein
MQIIPANELTRSRRVILALDEPPHLVKRIVARPSGQHDVEFESGEFRQYGKTEPVVVAD